MSGTSRFTSTPKRFIEIAIDATSTMAPPPPPPAAALAGPGLGAAMSSSSSTSSSSSSSPASSSAAPSALSSIRARGAAGVISPRHAPSSSPDATTLNVLRSPHVHAHPASSSSSSLSLSGGAPSSSSTSRSGGGLLHGRLPPPTSYSPAPFDSESNKGHKPPRFGSLTTIAVLLVLFVVGCTASLIVTRSTKDRNLSTIVDDTISATTQRLRNSLASFEYKETQEKVDMNARKTKFLQSIDSVGGKAIPALARPNAEDAVGNAAVMSGGGDDAGAVDGNAQNDAGQGAALAGAADKDDNAGKAGNTDSIDSTDKTTDGKGAAAAAKPAKDDAVAESVAAPLAVVVEQERARERKREEKETQKKDTSGSGDHDYGKSPQKPPAAKVHKITDVRMVQVSTDPDMMNMDAAHKCVASRHWLFSGNSNMRSLYFSYLNFLTEGTSSVVTDKLHDYVAACPRVDDKSKDDKVKRAAKQCEEMLRRTSFKWSQEVYDPLVERILHHEPRPHVLVFMSGLLDVLGEPDVVGHASAELAFLGEAIARFVQGGGRFVYLTLPPLCTPRVDVAHVHNDTNRVVLEYNALMADAVTQSGGDVIDYFSFIGHNGNDLQRVAEWEKRGCEGFDNFINVSPPERLKILQLLLASVCASNESPTSKDKSNMDIKPTIYRWAAHDDDDDDGKSDGGDAKAKQKGKEDEHKDAKAKKDKKSKLLMVR